METCASVSFFALSICFGFLASSSDAVKVVYTRAYENKDLGVARSYHPQYFDLVRKSSYYQRKVWHSYIRCGNFEANSRGDYMGFFRCNLNFEPYTFTYCCGKQGVHYCCPNASLATPYLTNPYALPDPIPTDSSNNSHLTNTGIGIGAFVAIVCIVVVIIRVFFYCHFFNHRRMNAIPVTTSPRAAIFATAASNTAIPQQTTSDPSSPPSGVPNQSFTMRPEPFAPPPYPGPEMPPPSYQSVTHGTQPVITANQPPAYPNKET